MVGIYFSGTGNTKFCVTEYVNFSVSSGRIFSIEDENVNKAFVSEDGGELIVLGFPSHDGNVPTIMKTFIEKNKGNFSGREVLILVTMAKPGGDVSSKCAQLLKSAGARIYGSIYVNMPDIRTDVEKRFTSIYQNKDMVKDAVSKIHSTIIDIKRGKMPNDGLGIRAALSSILNKGLTKEAPHELKLDTKKCSKCMECIEKCPTKNIKFENKKIAFSDKCTMCYRCINICPRKAITFLGKEIEDQSRIEMYIDETK